MVDQTQARKLFDTLDLNKNGVITHGELITAVRMKARDADVQALGFKDPDDIANFFDQADADKNQELTFDEFLAALNARNANS
ncbi:EF-hand domain-containing protein [Nocardia sp. NPDC049149]|uniref:EF-hand domain-containing protein n=1 Tax=Nocardia sp. NPDC049149 TaxID=3364315 RepID=UPI0037247F8B